MTHQHRHRLISGFSCSRRRKGDERGSMAAEAVIVIPAILLLVALFAVGYRLWSARSAVAGAAEAGARAASLAGNPSTGQARAADAVAGNLQTLGVRCASQSLTADVGALAQPPGSEGSVSVTLTCVVDLRDLGLPGGGSLTVTRSASERVDTFGERRP